ncbi:MULTISPECIES: urease accessory protein UreE [Niastella]|uniref:Urease accessory protein UreE n=1 Tax=Niastella soli TaxID=2821487 RepID=A0ABS3Z5H5_9BACT|nr:urease accessory protein UreE [Niastella soli]MBO9204987.1 urease accessory protein UreE [Niastella soli]
MLIQQKKGHLTTIPINNRYIDWLPLEWYETSKRIMRKQTLAGNVLALKFLDKGPALAQGDILFEDDIFIIAVDILPCDVLVIQPAGLFEMASVCYEIGNKHLPLFFEKDEVLVPFDMPLFRLLSSQGYSIKQDKRKLLYPLKSTVAPHSHHPNSLFSKIMQLTNTSL